MREHLAREGMAALQRRAREGAESRQPLRGSDVMSLLVFLLVAFSKIVEAQQLQEGDACSLVEGSERLSGKCERLDRCQHVYRGLQAGIAPDELCGYSLEYDPIICCPVANSTRSTDGSTAEPTTPYSVPSSTVNIGNRDKPGDLARRKCTEYAKSVYALVPPRILSPRAKPVNISLCAIKKKKLIVGGTRADPKEFPHMAAVGFIDSSTSQDDEAGPKIVWLCGGTLVSNTFVLTAAHCTFSLQYGVATRVKVGDLDLAKDDEDSRPQERRIVERIRHPDYHKPSEYHDMALLRLESPIVFDAYVRPACLPTSQFPGTEMVVATGWGRVNWSSDTGSSHLLKVTLPTVSQERCNASYIESGGLDYKLDRGVIDEWQICAGREGRDTCQGDSGGPIVIFDPDHYCMYDVVGITSLGRWCGGNVPGVYTRVYNYLTWLENTIWR